ncbi:solute carrier family 35 member C2 isoform X2 [Opisthocomus hoazin]|uniref:solute carrier family 35 member C2 isoform X2 n=1 Tax=Opisthocomus hoazin TaxID=30419 RepID=UPI003F53BD00
MAAGVGGAALGRAALAAPLVLLYYCFSIGITFYNKWLMKSFPFPLLVTLLHLVLIFGLSALARALARCRSGRPRAELSWADCLRRAAPAALSTSLDIGLSNWSFLYVTVSLYTMTKSSAILFILLFSLLFKLEEMRVTLLLVVLLIAGGLFMFTYKSTQFSAQGFMLVLCASFLGGIRWTLTQILMQKAELGLPLSISEKLFHFHEAGMLCSLVGKLFLGGILAFGLGFSEFLLVSRTSSLTLSIAGIFKEICILFLATHLLGDRLSLLNWLGFAVCLSGISLHVILKAVNSKGCRTPGNDCERPPALFSCSGAQCSSHSTVVYLQCLQTVNMTALKTCSKTLELRICENCDHRLVCGILHTVYKERQVHVQKSEAATAEVYWAGGLLCPPRAATGEEKPSLAMDMEYLQKVGVFPRKLQVTTNVALNRIVVKACKM